MFKVGQRVVCVDDSAGWISGVKKLEKGAIYEVLRMSEVIKGDVYIVGFEKSWDASRFAPIQEYGDSLSIAMELIQDMERVDKPVNPKVKEVQNA